MVMHARKLPRLSDGYFDRNQTHSFENSSKYSKSNDRTNEKIRGSPITSNSDNTTRNDILDNRSSPRYHRPCSQRLKDKDHHDDSSNKSPIVKGESKSNANKEFHKAQSSVDRDGPSEHYQSNHERNASELESEKRLPLHDWSEHMSSSGKKYYYNCKTEVSQWEKPKELIEWERQQSLNRLSHDASRTKERVHERVNATSGGSKTLRTVQQALQLTKQVTTLSQSSVSDIHHQKPSASPAQSQNQVHTTNHHPVPVQTTQSSNTTYHVNSTGASYPEGKNDTEKDRTSPGSDSSTHSVRHESPTSSVSSLHSLSAAGTSSLATAALKPSIPSLTPSLANYYREDLISHVTGWQADHAERQANRYWEEGNNIGSLNCTQVSAELKMARALVRLAEIQATLQEQRILFLRQQTKELDEWRSLNSFMGDS